ncbi:MAG: lysylphosphatidylglycerol synthase transmembrane domain-containing protein [Pyrinomonadaceae bacterium]
MRRYLKFAVLCLVAALALWWFGHDLPWADVRREVQQANWQLIALALVIICNTYLVRALRWRVLIAPLAPARLVDLFAATTVGFGAIFAVGRAGEILRPAFLPLRDERVRPGAAFVTIGVERICDTAAVVVIFALNLLWFRVPGSHAEVYGRVRWAGLLLLGALVGGLCALLLLRRHANVVIGWLDARTVRAPQLLKRANKLLTGLLAQLAEALGVLTDARELAVVVGWTALLWMIIAVGNFLVLRAFHLPFGLSATLFVLGWALVGSLVPTPGGAAGAFHLVTAAGLTFLGIAEAKAKSVSIVLHLVLFAPAFFFGLYYFLRSDVSLARLRSLAATEAAEARHEEKLHDKAGEPKARVRVEA